MESKDVVVFTFGHEMPFNVMLVTKSVIEGDRSKKIDFEFGCNQISAINFGDQVVK